MKGRRKRRSPKEIEECILDAASRLIEKDGFSKLTVTGIINEAEIEPVQFYNRHEDLYKFIDEFVKKYDYWFSDVVKSQKQSINDKELYINTLTGLFNSLLGNKVMQELLKWELANNNETSQRTAKLRELHTLPLSEKYTKAFSNTDIDIVAISALLVGGIYYLILHNELSPFSGIDLKIESDRERIFNVINNLSNILFKFTSLSESDLDTITKMKNDNIPIEKIAYYTGVSIDVIASI